MRIVFMGTPDFSVPALNALVRGGHQVCAVVTQPDKPKGRGKSLQMTPVKERALELGIPVVTPERVRGNQELLQYLKELNPDVIVVIAFGQILDEPVLRLPRYGCVNIHASLLPRYRGAAPIQWAVINGEPVSGVTTMQMDEGLDTGDMLDQTIVPLEKDETGGSLFDKLAAAGGELILTTLKKLEDGTSAATPQTGESNYVGTISKAMGEIDWTLPARRIERLIRGLNPWPSAYTHIEGKTLKLWKANVVEADSTPLYCQEPTENNSQLTGCRMGSEADSQPVYRPGQIVAVNKDSFIVQCGRDRLKVLELQLEGKKRMDAAAFLRGFSLVHGQTLGEELP